MSRWAETFAALSRDVVTMDTLDTSAIVTTGDATVSRSVHSVTGAPEPVERQWAEGFARLDPDRPPADVPRQRWQTFVHDVFRFLDSDFAAVAAALGWGPHDLFGCDRDHPIARLDHAGLLWLLNGDVLVDLDRHKAVIKTKNGARQTYHRKPVAVGEVVLPWGTLATRATSPIGCNVNESRPRIRAAILLD
jgi:hypothetical protein